jgi:TetR/AcrR family transcriptional regulator, fatty acid biosynthesis regulator
MKASVPAPRPKAAARSDKASMAAGQKLLMEAAARLAARQGLSDARAALRPGEVPTQKVIGWLFDFASGHRDVFIVAMRERFGPPGPLRDAVRRLLEQLTADTQRDLTMLGFLPDIDPDYMRRVLEVSVNEVFRNCIEYLERPRRRQELLAATHEVLETLLAGAVLLDARGRSD